MKLKHPDDPAVAWHFEAFASNLRNGLLNVDLVESALNEIKRLDEEAEKRQQAKVSSICAEIESLGGRLSDNYSAAMLGQILSDVFARAVSTRKAELRPGEIIILPDGAAPVTITLPNVAVKSEAELRLDEAKDKLIEAMHKPINDWGYSTCKACGGKWRTDGIPFHMPNCALMELQKAKDACDREAAMENRRWWKRRG